MCSRSSAPCADTCGIGSHLARKSHPRAALRTMSPHRGLAASDEICTSASGYSLETVALCASVESRSRNSPSPSGSPDWGRYETCAPRQQIRATPLVRCRTSHSAADTGSISRSVDSRDSRSSVSHSQRSASAGHHGRSRRLRSSEMCAIALPLTITAARWPAPQVHGWARVRTLCDRSRPVRSSCVCTGECP